MKKPKGLDKHFEITSFSKNDILGMLDENGKPVFKKSKIKSLKEVDMKAIARKMEESYVQDSFWIDLKFFVEAHLKEKNVKNSQ